MAEPVVPLARMAHLTLVAFEVAFAAQGANGGAAPAAEVRYTIGRLALAAPETAARLPRVRGALPPETLAVVLAHVSAAPATPPAAPQPDAADSGLVYGSTEAARLLALSPQAVRAAAKRGTLRGTKDRVTGEWRFALADIEAYREGRHASQQG